MLETFLNENHKNFNTLLYTKRNTWNTFTWEREYIRTVNLKDWDTNSKKSLSINFTNAQTDFSIFDNGSIRILLNLPTFQTGKKYVLFREKIEIDDKKYGSCSYSIYLR